MNDFHCLSNSIMSYEYHEGALSFFVIIVSNVLFACRNKLRSPIISSPFSLRTEERAVTRKKAKLKSLCFSSTELNMRFILYWLLKNLCFCLSVDIFQL
jgi:hypothetical protein